MMGVYELQFELFDLLSRPEWIETSQLSSRSFCWATIRVVPMEYISFSIG